MFAQVGAQAPAQGRQRFAEGDDAVELAAIALAAPLRVVTVLLAPAGIAPAGLQVATRVGADSHLGPGGGNGQGADPFQGRLVAQRLAVGVEVGKTAAPAPAAQAGRGVADVAQPGRGGGLPRLLGLLGGHAPDCGGAAVNAAQAPTASIHHPALPQLA